MCISIVYIQVYCKNLLYNVQNCIKMKVNLRKFYRILSHSLIFEFFWKYVQVISGTSKILWMNYSYERFLCGSLLDKCDESEDNVSFYSKCTRHVSSSRSISLWPLLTYPNSSWRLPKRPLQNFWSMYFSTSDLPLTNFRYWCEYRYQNKHFGLFSKIHRARLLERLRAKTLRARHCTLIMNQCWQYCTVYSTY